jgi:1-phosphatidylinositol-4-phosphate 5-kinase
MLYRHGLGAYRFANGDLFEGSWVYGRKNGTSVNHYSNGDYYEGDYVNDVKQGKGYYRLSIPEQPSS